MAGSLTISTLKDSSGVLATQNGMTGICKAWVNFQGGNGNTAGTINGSFNVSSITVSSTGIFYVNFTTAMPNANYVTVPSGRAASSGTTDNSFASLLRQAPTTTQTGVFYASTSGTAATCYEMDVLVIGS